MGFGLINLPAIVMVSTYFEEKRAFAQGIAQAGAGIGTLLMAPLVNLLDDTLGWANALAVIGGLVLLCVPLAAVFRPLATNGHCGEGIGGKGCYIITQGKTDHVRTKPYQAYQTYLTPFGCRKGEEELQ